MANTDLEKEVAKQLGGKEMKLAIEKIVKERIKSDPELESKVVEISKNVLIQLFKALWVKRGFWSDSLKNKSS